MAPEGFRQMNVRLEAELLARFQEIALEQGLTFSEAARWAIAEWVERHG